MKIHYKPLIHILISGLTLLSLTSCSSMFTSKMPSGSNSMQQSYDSAINGATSNDSIDAVRSRMHYVSNTNTQHLQEIQSNGNAIDSQFARLPNPNIVMYVYPHQAGSGNNLTPVPGYSTVFPLYQHVQYAMPGDMIAY